MKLIGGLLPTALAYVLRIRCGRLNNFFVNNYKKRINFIFPLFMLRTDKIEGALRNFRVHTGADFHERADPTKSGVETMS